MPTYGWADQSSHLSDSLDANADVYHVSSDPLVVEQDLNHDGRVDVVTADVEQDGVVDVYQYDLNGDGIIDMAQLVRDTDGDDRMDRVDKIHDTGHTMEHYGPNATYGSA